MCVLWCDVCVCVCTVVCVMSDVCFMVWGVCGGVRLMCYVYCMVWWRHLQRIWARCGEGELSKGLCPIVSEWPRKYLFTKLLFFLASYKLFSSSLKSQTLTRFSSVQDGI